MESDILNISNAYGYDADKFQIILESICGRRKQIMTLLKLFGPPQSLACQSIFIYGESGTAKSLVVSSLMQQLQLHHVWINCVEVYSPRYLFESVLNALGNAGLQDGNSCTDSYHCDNMCDFLSEFKSIIEDKQETTYIILDNAEMLRRLNYCILSAFLKLQELITMNVSVILISEITWEKFHHSTAVCEPYIIHFPDYNEDELLSILVLQCPSDVSKKCYVAYLKIMLRIFLLATRNVKELQYLANLNITKYMEPIKSGEASEEDLRKLWRHIEPHLKTALHTVYLREVSSYQFEEELQHTVVEPSKPVISRKSTELPFYSKFLLLASYIASYNPPNTDRKFFVKNHGRMSKKRPRKEKRLNNHLLGPKSFPLDRMLAIFYSIVEENVSPTAMLFSQIASLVSLRLLAHTKHASEMTVPKYKCLVSLDVIRNIGRTVNFDVLHYLNDFT